MAIHFISPPASVSSSVDHRAGTWYKFWVLRPDLPIQAQFLLRIAGFLFVLASGTVSLAAAEFLPLSAPEEAARLPLRDGVMSLDSSVEPFAHEGGSAAEEPALVVERSWYPRVDADPLAEAFTESSLLARVTPPTPTV